MENTTTVVIVQPQTLLDKLAEIHFELSKLSHDKHNTCPMYSTQIHDLAEKANLAIGELRWELTRDKLKV